MYDRMREELVENIHFNDISAENVRETWLPGHAVIVRAIAHDPDTDTAGLECLVVKQADILCQDVIMVSDCGEVDLPDDEDAMRHMLHARLTEGLSIYGFMWLRIPQMRLAAALSVVE